LAQAVADVLLGRLREGSVDGSADTRVTASMGSGRLGGRRCQRSPVRSGRHEEMAGFDAAGYAQFSGNVAVSRARRRTRTGWAHFVVQGAPQSAGRFESEVGMYESLRQDVASEHFYGADLGKAHRRAASTQTVRPLPPVVPRRVLIEAGPDEHAGQ
jgi:hypothetical protein